MDLLHKFHEWLGLDDKSCIELDERQLQRQIKQAYREEPPTPADELFAKIRTRAEQNTQLPPIQAQKPAIVVDITPAQLRHAKRLAHEQHAKNEIKTKEAQNKQRSTEHREVYRQFMDYAINQMRLNVVESSVYFV